MECRPKNRAKGRGKQNSVDKMHSSMLNMLISIKETLVEIQDQGENAATTEDTQLAVCPECGEYEVCNQTTSTCELRGCDQESDLVNEIADEFITATSINSWGNMGPEQSRLNSSMAWAPQAQSPSEYLQFEFPNLKIVQAMITTKKSLTTSYVVTKYNVTTSTDCSEFTSTLPNFETGTQFNVTTTFPTPVLAKCVRVHAVTWEGSTINMKIGLLGCTAE